MRQSNPNDCYGTEREHLMDFPTEPFDINIPGNITQVIEDIVRKIAKYIGEIAKEGLRTQTIQTGQMENQTNLQSAINIVSMLAT